ncbi:hypothetical protein AB0I22_23200 [Streptomyces sp. NPDC050610]|uniref:hypothetical protein n=1 Tax=Streptomyces sp. NPDC050610 TaxID=3157097 RepID=UPI003436978A
MTLLHPSGVFVAVRRYFAEPRASQHILLHFDTEDRTMSLTAVEAYDTLYGPTADPALGAEVWREAIRAAKDEEEPYGPRRLLLIWLAQPRLYSAVRKISRGLRDSQRDIESEMVLGLLEAVPAIDPDSPQAPDALLTAARRRAGRYRRALQPMTPVDHIEAIARNDDHPGADGQPGESPDWEMHIARPDGPEGLRAPLRFPVSAAQVEGERLGSLAARLGLHAVVRRSGQGARRQRIGTVSLRPRRKRR